MFPIDNIPLFKRTETRPQEISVFSNKVKGRFEILAAMDNAAVLIQRNGVKQIVSRTKPLQIFPHRVRTSIGKEQQITTEEIDMAGRTLGEIPPFADAERVLFYGYLTPAKFTPETPIQALRPLSKNQPDRSAAGSAEGARSC